MPTHSPTCSLLDTVPTLSLRWTASQVQEACASRGVTPSDLLATLVSQAAQAARPPISRFRVGAAALGSSGSAYLGFNVEFAAAPLHCSIHAEQFAVANAFAAGETALEELAVSAAPCGHCRQFLNELPRAGELRVRVGDGEKDGESGAEAEAHPLRSLLPRSFGPEDLLDPTQGERMLSGGEALGPGPAQRHRLELKHAASCDERGDQGDAASSRKGDLSPLLQRALQAACCSHAPYTSCPSGVALGLGDGGVAGGSYLECAAFNPSLGPFQAAIVDALVRGEGNLAGGLLRACCVELADAPVQQRRHAEMLAQSLGVELCWAGAVRME